MNVTKPSCKGQLDKFWGSSGLTGSLFYTHGSNKLPYPVPSPSPIVNRLEGKRGATANRTLKPRATWWLMLRSKGGGTKNKQSSPSLGLTETAKNLVTPHPPGSDLSLNNVHHCLVNSHSACSKLSSLPDKSGPHPGLTISDTGCSRQKLRCFLWFLPFLNLLTFSHHLLSKYLLNAT